MKTFKVSRRQVLRGGAGFTLGMPFLPSLVARRADGATPVFAKQLRFVASVTEHGGLYVSNMFSSAGNRIAYQRQFQENADTETRAAFQRHARGNSLFLNSGDGSFRDVSVSAGVTMGRWAWGSRFVDINNDGWEDLFVANGFITQTDPGDL